MEWMIRGRRELFEDLDSFTSLMPNPEEFNDAYAELRACHVLARVEGFNGERWAMHRLVRDYGRARLKSGEVMTHAMALSEWLQRPTLPLSPEILHFVAVILDAARYVAEFPSLRGRRFLAHEIGHHVLSSHEIGHHVLSSIAGIFDIEVFIRFIRDELRDPKALTMILQGVTDINEDVRIRAIHLLENIGPTPEVLEALTASLDDPEPRVRAEAISTWAKHGGEKTINLLNAVVQDPNPLVRLEAVCALRLMGEKAHNALKDALGSDDRRVRIEAALLLCEQEQREGADTLIEAFELVSGEDPKRSIASVRDRERIVRALGNVKVVEAVPPLIKALENDDDVRIEVIKALGRIGDPEAIPALIKASGTNDDDVRREATRALGLIPDPSARAHLTYLARTRLAEIAKNDPDRNVRKTANEALKNIKGESNA